MLELLKAKGKYCTGCGACYNICPKDAIHMEPDPQGFLYPVIDESSCIHCNRCEQVCPKLGTDVQNAREPDCYAARAQDDVRAVSSSGGMFTLLARWVLAQGGVVCGAAMEEDFTVHHVCVSDEEGLAKLRKSKYVQSNTEHVYREIAGYLKEGRKVLFSGCPCQVAGARKYFGKNAKNIYYVDILCHGTPSVQMWQDYLHENFNMDEVSGIEFRNKVMGWRSDRLYIRWKKGSTQVIPREQSAYSEGFQRRLTLRDGCDNCEFGGYQRQGDLTFGDFWGIERSEPSLNDKKGTSVVFVNNPTGQELLNTISGELLDIKKMPLTTAQHNRVHQKAASNPQKGRFKTLYPGHTFTEAVLQCRDRRYDVGQIGNYTISNYGGELTQYALYCALTNMGYSVLMIERPMNAPEPPAERPLLFEKTPYPEYAVTRRFSSVADMKNLNRQCKVFVTGSDQMFNNNLYNLYGKFMVQNFVEDNHWKVAYAASFGHDHIWGSERDRAEEAYFMQKFDRFSVRENVAVDVCKNEFGVAATWVLDPVFLCPPEKYQQLVESCSQQPPEKPYLFAYMLDPNQEKETILNNIARKRNLSVRAVADGFMSQETVKKRWSIETLFGMKIESWLSHIFHCDYFVTDSFHGMCFAIIFRKQFLVLVNELRGGPRFTSLLTMLGLSERLCYSEKEMMKKIETLPPIDYNVIEKKLENERARCRKWLFEAIEAGRDVKRAASAYDILDRRCDSILQKVDNRCNDLERQVQELRRSPSFRIGRAITWLPRKIRGGFRCVKENGWKYTIRHFGEKVKGKFHH